MELSSDGSAQKAALNGAQLRSLGHLTQDFDRGMEPADRIRGPAEAREGGTFEGKVYAAYCLARLCPGHSHGQ